MEASAAGQKRVGDMPDPIDSPLSASKRRRAAQIAAGALFALAFLAAGMRSSSPGCSVLFSYSGLIAGGCIAGWKATKPKTNAALVGVIVQLVYLGAMVYGSLVGKSEPPDLPFVPLCTFGFLVSICVIGGAIAQFVSV
jgi:hypothetical protein